MAPRLPPSRGLNPIATAILLPLVTTAVLYGLFLALSAEAFSLIKLRPLQRNLVYVPDFFAQLVTAYLIYFLCRRRMVFLLIQALIMGLIYIGNPVKIAFFASPISMEDILATGELLTALELWQAALVVVPIGVLFALLVYDFRRSRGGFVALGLCAAAGLALGAFPGVVAQAVDARFPPHPSNPTLAYKEMGGSLYLMREAAAYLDKHGHAPSREAIETALTELGAASPAAASAGSPTRNVHMILVESLWDAALLKNAGLSADPFHPQFRALWASAGYSTAMSPTFGGMTANAEYEALCGQPVLESGVIFQHSIVQDIPCLPRLLADQGYQTLAFQPVKPSFFNAENAYRHIGFERFFSVNDFMLDDLNGGKKWLADSSLFRQVRDLSRAEDNRAPANQFLRTAHAGETQSVKPRFSYIMSVSSHWPFKLDEKTRPRFIHGADPGSIAESYANSIWYTTKELMDYVTWLRGAEPDALIVIAGDHLPELGAHFAAYAQSRLLATDIEQFTGAMYRTYISTPLVIIDGQRGVIQPGTVSMFEIPRIVLGLLGQAQTTIADLHPFVPGHHVRPLPSGVNLIIDPSGAAIACVEEAKSPLCAEAAHWRSRAAILTQDLTRGKQHALAIMPPH